MVFYPSSPEPIRCFNVLAASAKNKLLHRLLPYSFKFHHLTLIASSLNSSKQLTEWFFMLPYLVELRSQSLADAQHELDEVLNLMICLRVVRSPEYVR